MEIRSLGFQTDLAILERGGSSIEDRGDHLVIRTPSNPTFWWGNFLLVDRVPPREETDLWLERFEAAFPDAAHRSLGIDVTDGQVSDLAPFIERGLGAACSAVMTAREVNEPPRPNRDAVLRRLTSDEDWEQHVTLRVACADPSIDPEDHRIYIEHQSRSMRALCDKGHGVWFGAFVDGHLACQMGLVSVSATAARFQSVETDPAFRRRQLASTLVHHVSRFGFDHLRAETLVMVADPDYFAIDLYRAVGFQVTETQLQVERRPPTPS